MDFEKYRAGLRETLTGCSPEELQAIGDDVVNEMSLRGLEAAIEVGLPEAEVKKTGLELFIEEQRGRLAKIEGNQRFLDKITTEMWQTAQNTRDILFNHFADEVFLEEGGSIADFNILIVSDGDDNEAELAVALTSYGGLFKGSWNEVQGLRKKRNNPFKVKISQAEKPVDALGSTTLMLHRSMVATARANGEELPDSNSRDLWPTTLLTGEADKAVDFFAPCAVVGGGQSYSDWVSRGRAPRYVRVRPAVVVAKLTAEV